MLRDIFGLTVPVTWLEDTPAAPEDTPGTRRAAFVQPAQLLSNWHNPRNSEPARFTHAYNEGTMKTSILAGSLLASLALIAAPLESQTVSAEVVLRAGAPESYRAPRRVIVERSAPRVIVIERMRAHHARHWRHHGYRPVVVYYVGGRYYDQHPRRRSRMREIVVYERGGRYYHIADGRTNRGQHRGWSQDGHRHDWND